MSRVKGVILVAAMLVMSAIAVASAAAALPEFDGPFPKPFHSLGGAGLLETTGAKKVNCASNHVNGNITGPKTDLALIRFLGCENTEILPVKCNSSGQGTGVIQTSPILSLLGYLNKTTKEVGVLLEPDNTALFASFECGGIVKIEVKGTVVGKITPVNTKSKTFTLELKQAGGVPNPSGLEGQTDLLATKIGGGGFEDSGIQQTNILELDGGAESFILA